MGLRAGYIPFCTFGKKRVVNDIDTSGVCQLHRLVFDQIRKDTNGRIGTP
jgi:hypothetical protein